MRGVQKGWLSSQRLTCRRGKLRKSRCSQLADVPCELDRALQTIHRKIWSHQLDGARARHVEPAASAGEEGRCERAS